MKTIDLGQSYKDSMPEMVAKKDVHYPTLHIDGDQELGLPESGELTVKFKRVSESHSERDGKVSYSCVLEIHKILDVEGAEPEKKERTEDVLDALMKKIKAEKNGADSEEGY